MHIRLSVVVILLLALLGAGAATAQTPVSVARPGTSGSTETLRLTGNLTARRTASLSPRVAGRIERLTVDAGDRVEQGQAIAELDARLAGLQVDRAAALRDEAAAVLTEAQRLAEEGRRLTGSQFLPDTEVRAREAAVVAAEAALQRAEAELAIERERVARHVLQAPFGGIISARLAEPGEWVEPGRAVVELVEVDDLWLDVRVPQSYWADLARDRVEVRARADAVPGRLLDTEIAARVPVSDPSARTFLLRLLVHDESGDLTPGMSARVELDLVTDEPRTRIPRDALLRDPDGSTRVWLLPDGSDRVREQSVTVRRMLGDQAELVETLAGEVRVVVRGNEDLREDETVRVVEEMR
ncbi:MAG: efflux RND transporter periplasmic adaptor subunit [Wenzhouxiangella sp.]